MDRSKQLHESLRLQRLKVKSLQDEIEKYKKSQRNHAKEMDGSKQLHESLRLQLLKAKKQMKSLQDENVTIGNELAQTKLLSEEEKKNMQV
jgi:hypothetical protein